MIHAQLPTGPMPASFRPTAVRLWPTAEQVTGEGPYAVVTTLYGRTLITLWRITDDALDAKLYLEGVVASVPGLAALITIHDLSLFVEAEVAA